MGGTCGTYAGGKCMGEGMKGKGQLEDVGVTKRIILMKRLSKEIGWKGTGWNNLAQDKNKWWAVANTVMNLCVAKNEVNQTS